MLIFADASIIAITILFAGGNVENEQDEPVDSSDATNGSIAK